MLYAGPPRPCKRTHHGRRTLLRAAAVVGSAAAGGCALPQWVAAPTPLHVYVDTLDTAAPQLASAVRGAIDQAVGRRARLHVSADRGEAAPLAGWFVPHAPPPKLTLFTMGPSEPVNPAEPFGFPWRDRPSLPMPDIVVSTQPGLIELLAVRALDLAPALRVRQDLLAAIPAPAWAAGRWFSGSATAQTGIPLLRDPLVRWQPHQGAVPPTAWASDALGALVVAFAAAGAAKLATTSGQTCEPAFAQPAAMTAMDDLLRAARRSGHLPAAAFTWLTATRTLPTDVRVLPLPSVRRGRPAAARYVQAMVARDGRATALATQAVLALLEPSAQTRLAATGAGLPLRPSQANTAVDAWNLTMPDPAAILTPAREARAMDVFGAPSSTKAFFAWISAQNNLAAAMAFLGSRGSAARGEMAQVFDLATAATRRLGLVQCPPGATPGALRACRVSRSSFWLSTLAPYPCPGW